MLEVVDVDKGVKVSTGEQLPPERTVNLVLDTGLHDLVHGGLEAREVVFLRLTRRDEEDPVVSQTGVQAEILTDDLHGLLLLHTHVPQGVLDLEVDLGPYGEERHVVARHLLHEGEVGLGVTPGSDDGDEVEVLDAHHTKVRVQRELGGTSSWEVPEAEVRGTRALLALGHQGARGVSEAVRGGDHGGFDVTNSSGSFVTSLNATHGVHEGRLSGTGATRDGHVSRTLVAGLLEPLRHGVSQSLVSHQVSRRATALLIELVHREHQQIDSVHTSVEPFLGTCTHGPAVWVTDVSELTVDAHQVSLLRLGGLPDGALNHVSVRDVGSVDETVLGSGEIKVVALRDATDHPVGSQVNGLTHVVDRVIDQKHVLLSVDALPVLLEDVEAHVQVREGPPRHRVELERQRKHARPVGVLS
mmetsp:Transcript_30071/g.57955  ORF Transcript_30071/g.57955 Transcript_30071/m.57955 type:complete len:415 (+) Transcript_30071:334-1578(+)